MALVRAGAGVWAPTPEEVRYHVARLLNDPKALRAMGRAAKRFGRPAAAVAIADALAGAVEPAQGPTGPRFHGAV